MSAAVTTSMRSTLAGADSDVGPATSVTAAPASAAACASANPIFPELVLVIPRTGSIASNVGPAVISTRLPVRVFGLGPRNDRREYVFRFLHPAFTRFAAGLVAHAGTEHDDAVGNEPRDIALVRGVRPHLAVHRRRDEKRAVPCKRQRRQEIVGMAVRDLGEEIGGGGCDDNRIGAARQVDMAHSIGCTGGPQIGQHGMTRQRLHRHRCDEPACACRHHDIDGDIRLDEEARQFRSLVRGDAARQSEHDTIERGGRSHPCGRYVARRAKFTLPLNPDLLLVVSAHFGN